MHGYSISSTGNGNARNAVTFRSKVMSDLPETEYPNIRKAVFEMAMANNSPEDKVTVAHTLEKIYLDYSADDLTMMDEWIGTLDDDDLSILIDGEEDEMMELITASPLSFGCSESLKHLLNDAFDIAI